MTARSSCSFPVLYTSIINNKYWHCLNLNYDFWSDTIHWPFLDKTLIFRSGLIVMIHPATTEPCECVPQLTTDRATATRSDDFMHFVTWAKFLLSCSKIVTKCYYFWHRSSHCMCLIASHGKKRINMESSFRAAVAKNHVWTRHF